MKMSIIQLIKTLFYKPLLRINYAKPNFNFKGRCYKRYIYLVMPKCTSNYI